MVVIYANTMIMMRAGRPGPSDDDDGDNDYDYDQGQRNAEGLQVCEVHLKKKPSKPELKFVKFQNGIKMREVGPKQKPVASKRQSWVEYLSFQFYNFLLIFYGIFVKEKSKINFMECFIIKKKK